MILLFFTLLIIYMTFIFLNFTKKKKTLIEIKINTTELCDSIKGNETKLFDYICKEIDMEKFKYKFYEIIKQYNLVIKNKIIYDRALENPNGEIFKYIFNHESCKMLLEEGIFCEIHFQNINIPIQIVIL